MTYCDKCKMNYSKKYNEKHCCNCVRNYSTTEIQHLTNFHYYELLYYVQHCCTCKIVYNIFNKHCCECKIVYTNLHKHCCECKIIYNYRINKHCCKCKIYYNYYDKHCRVCMEHKVLYQNVMNEIEYYPNFGIKYFEAKCEYNNYLA